MSEKDIHDVTTKAKLLANDFEHLYLELRMSVTDIERIKHDARDEPSDIQAYKVLKEWLQQNGDRATRQVIIDALEKDKRNEAAGILRKQWKMTIKGTANYYVIN